jgi:GNAT superfamily N-acetyltransferase
MSDVVVKPVETRAERKQFLHLPWEIYKDNPVWVPPLRRNQEELLGFRHHPFYDDAKGQAFLALKDGQPVGRVHAIMHYPFFRRYKERRGYFGFFESIDDVNVSRALFEAARHWFAQHDVYAIRGPINPSLNYECGLLIEGFDIPPTFMMTYNQPYYPELVEDAGFEKTQDMYSFWGHVDMLKGLDEKLAFVVHECTRRFDIKLRSLDKRRFVQEVRMFLDIYNQSLVGTWGFTPMSEGEIAHAAEAMKYLIVPEMTTVAEIDGRPVGALFGLLDYNPRIKAINGRLFPFGFLRLLWNKKQIKKVRLISTNVIPEYQRWGLGVVLLSRLVPETLAWGIQEAEFSWVLESNSLSYKSLKRGGALIDKTYRLYDWGVPTPYVEANA